MISPSLSCKCTEIIPLADISDAYNVSTGLDPHEFIIRLSRQNSTSYFSSQSRDAIVKVCAPDTDFCRAGLIFSWYSLLGLRRANSAIPTPSAQRGSLGSRIYLPLFFMSVCSMSTRKKKSFVVRPTTYWVRFAHIWTMTRIQLSLPRVSNVIQRIVLMLTGMFCKPV